MTLIIWPLDELLSLGRGPSTVSAARAEIFHIDPRRFMETDTMETDLRRQMLLQLLPDGDDQVLRRAHLAPHEIHVQVEVLVIQLFDDVFTYDLAQSLDVKDETGIRIWLPLDGHIKLIVMPMPVLVGAFAKDLFIPLPAPARVVEFMCRIKMFQTRQEYQRKNFRKGNA